MAGFDPILDGTAADGIDFKLVIFPDGIYEVQFPDETVGLYGDYPQAAHAMVSYLKRSTSEEA